MKRITSFIIIFAMFLFSVITSVSASEDETVVETSDSIEMTEPTTDTLADSTDPSEKQYPVPFSSYLTLEEYSALCKEIIPAIGDIEISFVEEIPSEISEIITDDEIRILDEENMVRVSGYPQNTDGLLDNCCLARATMNVLNPIEGYFVLVFKTEIGMVPYAVHYHGTYPGGVSPTETEPTPVETEKLPGTGTTEPVAAPKTADRIAVITAVLALSLTACAAVFTVVKEKSR